MVGGVPDINPSLPQVGQPDSTEEPKVVTALTQLIAAVNNVDTDQIEDGTILTADIADDAITRAKIGYNDLEIPQLAGAQIRYGNGSMTIPNGASVGSLNVTHGFDHAPVVVMVTPNFTPSSPYVGTLLAVSTIGASVFTLTGSNLNGYASGIAFGFQWLAIG